MTDDRAPSSALLPTWAAGLLAWGAGLALPGSVLMSVALLGTSDIAGHLIDELPWIVVLVLAVVGWAMGARRGTPITAAAAVLGAFIAGPLVVRAVLWLDLGFDEERSGLFLDQELGSDVARPLAIAGGAVSLIAALLAVAGLVIAIRRFASVPVGATARSPFRIEAIGAVIVLVIAAVAQLATEVSGIGDLDAQAWVTWLSWLVPLALLLSLGLRRPGALSLWIIGGLLIAVVVEPLVQVFIDRPGAPSLGTAAFLAAPSLLLALVIVWWNATMQPERRSPGNSVVTAPLEPWAGVAFVLSCVPVLFLPAIVLGHISYERIEASGTAYRGRILAAAAILLSFISLALVALFATGSLSTARDFLGGF